MPDNSIPADISFHGYPPTHIWTAKRMNYQLERVYYGEILGEQDLYQLSYQALQEECHSSNLDNGDSTGLRAYSGSPVAVRFLAQYPSLISGKNIVEIGSGVGVFGILGSLIGQPSLLLLTDGEMRAQELVSMNIELSLSSDHRKIHTAFEQRILKWGNADDVDHALQICGQHSKSHFDVVLGCELMYFNTDLDALISTVIALTNSLGLFLHAHVFRAPGQEQAFIDKLDALSWTTLEVPCVQFISKSELDQQVHWRRVRTLVSGSVDNISRLHKQYPLWRVFQPEIVYDDDSDTDDPR